MDELKPCPFCGGKVEIKKSTRYPKSGKRQNGGIFYSPVCVNLDCVIYDADSWYHLTEKGAIAAWNRRIEPENKPLTLVELQQMDGQPVWAVSLKNTFTPGWMLISAEVLRAETSCEFLEFEYYNTDWLAYRYPPKTEQVKE